MLLDSKVNPLPGIGQNPGSSTSGQNSAFGSNTNSASNTNSTASSGFGSGFSSDFGSSSSSSTGQVVVPRIPQRAPAVPANGSTATQQNSSGSWTDPNSLPPVVPTDQAGTSLQVEQPATSTPNQAGAANPPAGNAAQANATQSSAAQAGGGSFNVAAGHPTSTTSTFGRINSGGIAGVASKAQGHSIKKVNDQSDYSLWEFYYDASKDAAQGVAGALAGMGAGAGNRVQQPGGIQTPASDQSSPNQQVSPGVAAPNPAAGPQPGSAPPPSLDNPPPQ